MKAYTIVNLFFRTLPTFLCWHWVCPRCFLYVSNWDGTDTNMITRDSQFPMREPGFNTNIISGPGPGIELESPAYQADVWTTTLSRSSPGWICVHPLPSNQSVYLVQMIFWLYVCFILIPLAVLRKRLTDTHGRVAGPLATDADGRSTAHQGVATLAAVRDHLPLLLEPRTTLGNA